MSRREKNNRLRRQFQPRAWAIRHMQVLFSSLGRLWQHPWGSLLNILVIAIAMALPAGLHLLVGNLEQLASNWRGGASATLFLKQDISNHEVQRFLSSLRTMPEIGEITHLTPQQALAEFRQYSGLGDALSLLKSNPLPHVVLIHPADANSSVEKFGALVERLRKKAAVDRAFIDLQWVARFQGMVQLLQRGSRLLALLLSLAVLLVIGNTIRLEIQGRHQEIEIIKLVGGSHAFIRRPFLYQGFWYGLLGGFGAALLVWISLLTLQSPIRHLSQLYGDSYHLMGMGFGLPLLLLFSGGLLGVLGAWVAVRQQLSRVEPAGSSL